MNKLQWFITQSISSNLNLHKEVNITLRSSLIELTGPYRHGCYIPFSCSVCLPTVELYSWSPTYNRAHINIHRLTLPKLSKTRMEKYKGKWKLHNHIVAELLNYYVEEILKLVCYISMFSRNTVTGIKKVQQFWYIKKEKNLSNFKKEFLAANLLL